MGCKPLQSWDSFATELALRIVMLRVEDDAKSKRAANHLERGLNALTAILSETAQQGGAE